MLGPIWATALYMSTLPVPRCTLRHNGTGVDAPHHGLENLTRPCIGPGDVPSHMNGHGHEGGNGYTFGVRGYPGAWMFMTMGLLLALTLAYMFVVWRKLVPHPESSSVSTLVTAAEESGHDSQSLIN